MAIYFKFTKSKQFVEFAILTILVETALSLPLPDTTGQTISAAATTDQHSTDFSNFMTDSESDTDSGGVDVFSGTVGSTSTDTITTTGGSVTTSTDATATTTAESTTCAPTEGTEKELNNEEKISNEDGMAMSGSDQSEDKELAASSLNSVHCKAGELLAKELNAALATNAASGTTEDITTPPTTTTTTEQTVRRTTTTTQASRDRYPLKTRAPSTDSGKAKPSIYVGVPSVAPSNESNTTTERKRQRINRRKGAIPQPARKPSTNSESNN